jgi:hypothetical protein
LPRRIFALEPGCLVENQVQNPGQINREPDRSKVSRGGFRGGNIMLLRLHHLTIEAAGF